MCGWIGVILLSIFGGVLHQGGFHSSKTSWVESISLRGFWMSLVAKHVDKESSTAFHGGPVVAFVVREPEQKWTVGKEKVGILLRRFVLFE